MKAKTASFELASPLELSRWTGWKTADSISCAPENPAFVSWSLPAAHPTGLQTWNSSRMTPKSEEGVQEAYARVSKLYRRATELTSQLKEMEIPDLDLPDSPVGLSYMVSYVLDLGTPRKQELLESTSTVFRLRSLIDDLESAISQLQGQVARKAIGHKAIRNGDLGKPGQSHEN